MVSRGIPFGEILSSSRHALFVFNGGGFLQDFQNETKKNGQKDGCQSG